VEIGSTAGAMHQVADRAPGITLVEFGFDLEHLYLRVDGTMPMRALLASGLDLSVNFLKPAGVKVTVRNNQGAIDVRVLERAASGEWTPGEPAGVAAAVGQILELQVPFRRLSLDARAPVAFIVALNRGAAETEHHPRHRPIEFTVPDREFAAVNWTA
jgi:hypothetical protein